MQQISLSSLTSEKECSTDICAPRRYVHETSPFARDQTYVKLAVVWGIDPNGLGEGASPCDLDPGCWSLRHFLFSCWEGRPGPSRDKPSRRPRTSSSSRKTCGRSWSRSAGRATATWRGPRAASDLTSRPEPLEGWRQRPGRGCRRSIGQPARPGHPLRPRAEDAARRGSSRTARSRSCLAGWRMGLPWPDAKAANPADAGRDARLASPTHSNGSGLSSRSEPVAVPASATDPGHGPPSIASCWRPSSKAGWHPPHRPTGAP